MKLSHLFLGACMSVGVTGNTLANDQKNISFDQLRQAREAVCSIVSGTTIPKLSVELGVGTNIIQTIKGFCEISEKPNKPKNK